MAIGFIGCGNMATAIIEGIIKSNSFNATDIYAYDIFENATKNLKEKLGINICNDENDIVNKCDTVILAVKPNVLESVLKKISDSLSKKETLIISIAAGKTIDFIQNAIDFNNKIIRVMPNINAKVEQAISAYTTNDLVSNQDKELTETIFNSVGEIIYLEESYFSLFGVLGGCTPAMAYMFIDELARAGVKNGMKKDIALKIAAQAVLGSAKMILESDKHPYDLIDKVCSPGGTTIEAITSLQNDKFEAAIHNAVDKAVDKDKRL